MTQDEHAAAVAAAERRGIERAAAWIQQQAAQAQGFADKHLSAMDHEAWQGCADLHNKSAAAILALPPSDGAALAEAIQRERQACIADIKRAARDYSEWSARELSCAAQAAIRARGDAGR